MPLRADLLDPIPGPNPAGENLRYAPIYDQIKEARREEEAITEGDWQTPGKKANWPLVIKLAGDALATRSKDLQLAAWLMEALIRTEGYSAIAPCLELLRGLLENFWDGLYPEIEEGDLELRAAPLEWVGSQLEVPIKQVPLTRNGLDWFQYKQSRSVPTEEEAEASDARRAQREAAIADGKLTPEEFDSAFNSTPVAYYQQAFEHLEAAREALSLLVSVCDEKFGEYSPSFSGLRNTLEEVQQTVHILLQRRQPAEVPAAEATAAYEEAAVEEQAWAAEEAVPAERPAAPRRKVLALEPESREDAIERVIAAARYLRREDPYSPTAYLLVRALRWGELRAAGASPDYSVLEAPSTEVRQQLKRLASEGSWAEVLEAAEEAAGMPCGRAWLDVQRYAIRALTELGYEAPAAALRAELRSLLAEYPELPNWSLSDDTPAANAETQAWLKEEIVPPEPEQAPPEEVYAPAPPGWEEPAAEEAGEQPPDAYALAMEALRSGRRKDAVEILAREAAQERSGRARFQRRIQLAEVCMAAGYEAVAWPILEELAKEIEERRLEEWEAPEVIAHPLTLLFRCLSKLDRDSEEKQKIYARICRLDPIQALACTR